MRRWGWLLAVSLLGEVVLVAGQSPHAKPWLRAGYVKGFAILNRITGQNLPPPDRFK